MKAIEAAGLFLTALSTIGLLINIIVLSAIFMAKLHCRRLNGRDNDGNIYLLLTFGICTCTCREALYAFYWGPAAYFQVQLYDYEEIGPFSRHSTAVCLGLWVESMVTQVLIALNRLFAVEGISWGKRIFRRHFCVSYFVVVLGACIGAQYLFFYIVFPDNAYYYSHQYGTLTAMDFEHDLIFNYFYRPMNILSILISTFCYVTITLRSIHRCKGDTSRSVDASKQLRRTLPYAFTFIFFLCLYIFCETQPLYSENLPELNVMRSIFTALDCTLVALMPGVMNTTIRSHIYVPFYPRKISYITVSIISINKVSSTINTNNPPKVKRR